MMNFSSSLPTFGPEYGSAIKPQLIFLFGAPCVVISKKNIFHFLFIFSFKMIREKLGLFHNG